MTWPKIRAVSLSAMALLSALALPYASANPPKSSHSQSAAAETQGATVKKTLPPTSPAPTAQGASANTGNAVDRHASRGQYLARTALSYRGAPYRFGGRSPRSGFDCSGLVQTVYAKWGIMLPRAARAQYQMGKPVEKKDLKPGDLVFFKNTYRRGLSHVGIYLGEGYFVHAATRRQGVVVSNLNEGYHKQHWAGARRLDLAKLPPSPEEKAAQSAARVFLEDAEGHMTEAPQKK